MSVKSFARWISSSTRRASSGPFTKAGKRRSYPFLETLEGRNLPAPLTILPTALQSFVGASAALPLTATGEAKAITTFVSSPVGVANSDGLALDSSGNLYVANRLDNSIGKVTPNGTGSIFVPASAGLSRPSGLAFDNSGNLYVACLNDNTVRKVTPDGAVSTFVPAAAGIFRPEFLACDFVGNLYVSSSTQVNKVAPDGTVSAFSGSTLLLFVRSLDIQ